MDVVCDGPPSAYGSGDDLMSMVESACTYYEDAKYKISEILGKIHYATAVDFADRHVRIWYLILSLLAALRLSKTVAELRAEQRSFMSARNRS